MVKIGAAILIAALATSAWASACFDDGKLQALDFGQQQGALVYVWSPRMVLSAQHAASAQRQAGKHGLRFVPLHDASVPQAELDGARQRLLGEDLLTTKAPNSGLPNKKVANKDVPNRDLPSTGMPHTGSLSEGLLSAQALTSSQALCSAYLLEREALRHFPTAFVVQPSGVHRFPIVGAMPEAAWAASLVQRLQVPAVPTQAPGGEVAR